MFKQLCRLQRYTFLHELFLVVVAAPQSGHEKWLLTSNPQPIGFRGILLVKRQKFIYGYRVIGPNGNHIFLPASGCKFTCSEVFKKNETGMYWTSTQKGKGKIWCLMFASKFYDIYNGKYNEGYSIRPVW